MKISYITQCRFWLILVLLPSVTLASVPGIDIVIENSTDQTFSNHTVEAYGGKYTVTEGQLNKLEPGHKVILTFEGNSGSYDTMGALITYNTPASEFQFAVRGEIDACATDHTATVNAKQNSQKYRILHGETKGNCYGRYMDDMARGQARFIIAPSS